MFLIVYFCACVGAKFGLAYDKGAAVESVRTVKWSQKTGQSAKVYPKPLKGYENGEAPELYRPV